jgi:hypothetical protein
VNLSVFLTTSPTSFAIPSFGFCPSRTATACQSTGLTGLSGPKMLSEV